MFGWSKDDPYYQAGYKAFHDGTKLVDMPHSLTDAWQTGWLDALADSVRKPRKEAA
jgi:hypothetical protein